MHRFIVALVAATAWSDVGFVEPSEHQMREAFASDLRQGVRRVLAYVEQSGGAAAVRRIHDAHTDAFGFRGFRKSDCRRSDGKPGHVCDFTVEVDTVTGPIEKAMAGRFYIGVGGLAYDHDG
jgi:hypothetical protein